MPVPAGRERFSITRVEQRKEGATGVSALPEKTNAVVAIAGAIMLGSVVGTAMPTHIKPVVGPDWRERYGVSFDPSAPAFYTESAPQDLTPVSDPYFIDTYAERAPLMASAPALDLPAYSPAYAGTDRERVELPSTPGVSDHRIADRGSARNDAPDTAAASPARLSRIDAAASAAQQVAQAVNRAQEEAGMDIAAR